jgi:hypothetical protein
MATKVTDNYFEYGGLKYFRGNAHLVEIATYGEKKDPIGAKAYIDPQNKVLREHLVNRVERGPIVTLNCNGMTKANIEVNGPIKVFGLNVSVAAGFNYEKVMSADLKLCNLYIAEDPLKNMLNTDADAARNYLADEGNDGRIVSECWVVMTADLAEHFTTSGSVAASLKGSDLNITAKGGKQGTQTITLSKGATFAYKLHKVKDWNKGKTQIEDMEADYKGMG